MAAPGQWLDRELDRLLSEEKANVDTAKLLVTFAAAIAAGMAGAALQAAHCHPALHAWTLVLFGLSGLLAVAVILMDRLRGPDVEAILTQNGIAPMTNAQMAAERRLSALTALEYNRALVRVVRTTALAQVVSSMACASVAAAWLSVSL